MKEKEENRLYSLVWFSRNKHNQTENANNKDEDTALNPRNDFKKQTKKHRHTKKM